ncbi:hypothetical protein [Sulfitobacter aestuariivivens]|uniref:Phage holin family protein n=1 Tax=Sulfitobacter aestuariivivens TaxID=2766981 RepID=A0A927D4N7_9RHOB|nr:hypothetical protein [Sulfitobacter aestuariivivens]MBD3665115.1 hypothetical protein [Sulfitobacter aestuariivivens]
MIQAFLVRAKVSAAHTAQTAVLGLVGLMALLVGLAFFTLAAWLGLSAVTTPLNAALIIGAVYFGLAFVIFAVIALRARTKRLAHTALQTPHPAAPATAEGMAGIIAAFLAGLTAGRKSIR